MRFINDTHQSPGEQRAALQQCDWLLRLLSVAEQAGDLRCLCLVLPNLSLIANYRGEYVAGKQYVERAALLAKQYGAPILLAHVVVARGMNAFVLGDWQHSRQDYEQAVTLMRRAGMPWGAADALLHLGEQLLVQGQEMGSTYLEEAIELAQRSNDLLTVYMAQRALADQDLLLGVPLRAYERLKPLLEEDQPFLRFLLLQVVQVQLELGEVDQAQRLLEQARAEAANEQVRPMQVGMLLVQAWLAAHQEQ